MKLALLMHLMLYCNFPLAIYTIYVFFKPVAFISNINSNPSANTWK